MLRPGRAVTILDVAKAANVSKATVSVVLNGRDTSVRISQATRDAVLDAASQLGYTPNHAARTLRRRQTRALTFIVSRLGNPYYAEIATAAVDAAKELGYEVNVVDAAAPLGEHEALLHLRDGRADGVIVATARPTLRDAAVARESLAQRELARREIARLGLPMVILLDRGPHRTIPSIRIDDEEGGYLATRHLLALGHQRIAHVTIRPPAADDEPTSAADRYRGYRRALVEVGVPYDPSWLIAGWRDLEGGRAAARTWLECGPDRPTAVFAFNDLLAISLIRGLHEVGVRVPDDLALVGFDGIEMGRFTIPTLTTIDHPRQELGRLGVETLVALIAGETPPDSERVLPLRLVVRESCGAPSMGDSSDGVGALSEPATMATIMARYAGPSHTG